MWLVTITQKMMPVEDGVEYDFLFEHRPSREELIQAIKRLFEINKDAPSFADYHEFMLHNVHKIDWLADSADGGGRGTDEIYLHWKQISIEPQPGRVLVSATTRGKVIANLDTCDPNIAGEMLRELFFDQNKGLGTFGCYSTFKLRDFALKLSNEPIEWWDFKTDPPLLVTDRIDPDEGEEYTVAMIDNIKMRYHWDGDGYLEFILPNDTVIYNNDCKKEHGWIRAPLNEKQSYYQIGVDP